jgi:hypothetical protein
MNKIQELIEQLVPFILLGITIAAIIALFIMVSYVLIWGLVLGGILWIGVVVKSFLFPTQSPIKKEGRIIEYKDHVK